MLTSRRGYRANSLCCLSFGGGGRGLNMVTAANWLCRWCVADDDGSCKSELRFVLKGVRRLYIAGLGEILFSQHGQTAKGKNKKNMKVRDVIPT